MHRRNHGEVSITTAGYECELRGQAKKSLELYGYLSDAYPFEVSLDVALKKGKKEGGEPEIQWLGPTLGE